MDLGPHAFFIWAAYGVTALIVGALILRAVVDHRAQLRSLAALESRGARRRSEGASPDTPADAPRSLPTPSAPQPS
jgi:heme exporter protein D